MKIKFTDSGVLECSTGGFYVKNDGKGNLVDAEGEPINVPPAMIDDLLAMNHTVGGEAVPIFELVEEEAKPADAETKPEAQLLASEDAKPADAETKPESKTNSRNSKKEN